MAFLEALLSFVVAISVLITVHELGHYLVARACGVKVLRFSFGFGPALWMRKAGRDGTEWRISAFPLGGYVLMARSDDPEAPPASEGEARRAFDRQGLARRAAIILAGPLANFAFAVLAFTAAQMAGLGDARTYLARPADGTPAARAGILEADRVTAVDGRPVQWWSELRWRLLLEGLDAPAVHLTLRGIDGAEREAVLDLSSVPSRVIDMAWYQATGVAPGLGAPFVRGVAEGTPAAAAGLRAGDLVRSIDGVDVATAGELTRRVRAAPGRLQHWRIERGDPDGGGPARTLEVELTPAAWQPPGDKPVAGRAGIELGETAVVRRPAGEALAEGLRATAENSGMSLRMFARMLTGASSWRNLSGPVGIAEAAGATARTGAGEFLAFLAVVSVSIAVLNLLPLPVLDGGHLLYYLVELVTGKPLAAGTIERLQRGGVLLLVLLGLLALASDLARLLF